MLIIQVFLGVIALTMSRQLYWLFVGAVGFVLGFIVATQLLNTQTDGMILVYSLGTGFLFMLIAFALQRMAVELAGFAVGGYLTYSLVNYLGWNLQGFSWLLFLFGGLIGFGLMVALFDWTLIIMSSLFGTVLIIEPAQTLYGPQITRWLFIALFLLGIGIQFIFWRQERPLRT